MNKKLLRISSLVFVFMFVVLMFPQNLFSASAAKKQKKQVVKTKDYTYTIIDPKNKEIRLDMAHILEVDENGTYIIPSEYDGYKVTALNYFFLEEFRGYLYQEEDRSDELNKIKKLIIPEGIREINDPEYPLEPDEKIGFYDLFNLKEAILPSTMKVVPRYMFADCKKLEKVTLSEGLEEIDFCAFYNCKKLKKITLPKGLKVISSEAFYNCKSLKSIKLPNSLTTIRRFAFKNCKGLKGKFRITKNVRIIEHGAFEYCYNLSGFRVAEGNKHFSQKGGVLFKINKKGEKIEIVSCLPSKKTENYKIPSTVKKIDMFAFAGSKYIKKIILPNKLDVIDMRAFINSNIRSIDIPKSVRHIGDRAFYKCDKLEKIVIRGNPEYIYQEAIIECKKVTVYDHGNSFTYKDAKKCGFRLVKV